MGFCGLRFQGSRRERNCTGNSPPNLWFLLMSAGSRHSTEHINTCALSCTHILEHSYMHVHICTQASKTRQRPSSPLAAVSHWPTATSLCNRMAQREARPATPVPPVRRGVRIHGVPQCPEMGSSEVSVRSHVAQKQKPIWPNACSFHILPYCPIETRRVTRDSQLHPGPLMTHLCLFPQKLPETPSSM